MLLFLKPISNTFETHIHKWKGSYVLWGHGQTCFVFFHNWLGCCFGASNTECHQFVQALINSSLEFLLGVAANMTEVKGFFCLFLNASVYVCRRDTHWPEVLFCESCWTLRLKVWHRVNMWADHSVWYWHKSDSKCLMHYPGHLVC